MLVGEAPGEREDYIHRPFQGRAGKLLDSILYAFDIGREDIFITNAVRCRPKDNAKPSPASVEACHTYLQAEIDLVRPKLIIAMGAFALHSLKGTKMSVTASRKKLFRIKSKHGKIPMIVTFHPAAALRRDYLTGEIVKDFEWAQELLKNGYYKKPEPTKYQEISSLRESHVPSSSCVSLDLETDGLDPYLEGREILSVQVTGKRAEGYFLYWNEKVKQEIKDLVADPLRTIVNHNIKFDMKWLLSKAKIRIKGPVRDTMLEAHLLDENTPDKSLGTLASTHTTLKDHKDGLLNYRKEHGCSHAEVPPEIMIPYGCADVDAAIRLDEVFLPKLKKQGLLPLLKLESRAVKMFVEIENNGFKIDVDRVDELVDHYEGVIAEKEEIVRRIAGEEFNDRSAPQVYKLLYHKWDLPPMGLVKPWEGKTGYDTTEYTLVRLRARHDLSGKQERFLDALLFLRENRKLLSTYIMGMSDYLRTGNFLHPWFRLDGTVTGRLSCTGPNLQQIPREGPIKSLFISRYGKNGLVVQHDLSQAELRFAAHMSGERTLCRMFREGGTDIHLATAAQVLRKPIDQVTPQERKRAKTVNFGILYGTQKWTLAEKMGMTVRAAGRFIEEWKGVFSDWPPYEKAVRKEVLEKGYVVSPFGRRRRLPIIDPSSSQGKEALRQAINSPIQGGVCDLTLHCGWKAWQRVKKEKLDKVHIVAQVHDAWISDCHKSQARAFDEIMKEEFHHSDLSEFGFQMKVPMVLECSAGINWKEVQPW